MATYITYDPTDPETAYRSDRTHVTNRPWSAGSSEWWQDGERIVEIRPTYIDDSLENEWGTMGRMIRSPHYGLRFATRDDASRFLYENQYTRQRTDDKW